MIRVVHLASTCRQHAHIYYHHKALIGSKLSLNGHLFLCDLRFVMGLFLEFVLTVDCCRRGTNETKFRISPLQNLLSHFRFLLTLRSQEGQYHSLILFRLSSGSEFEHTGNVNDKTDETEADDSTSGILSPWSRQIYIMEASCPHLGADLSHAEIEECETGVVAVCPWHRFVSC